MVIGMRITCKKCDEPLDGKHPTYCNACRAIVRIKYDGNMSPEKKEARKKQMSDRAKEVQIWKNPEHKEKRNTYQKKRRKEDPVFHLHTLVSRSIQHACNGVGSKKKDRTLKYLGITTDKFKEHIESQFTEGMNWDNRGEWQLDHIVPKSLAKTEKDVYILSQWKNWQPLWRKDNMKKFNHIDYSHPVTNVILSELDGYV